MEELSNSNPALMRQSLKYKYACVCGGMRWGGVWLVVLIMSMGFFESVNITTFYISKCVRESVHVYWTKSKLRMSYHGTEHQQRMHKYSCFSVFLFSITLLAECWDQEGTH